MASQLLLRSALGIGYLLLVHVAILTNHPLMALSGLTAVSGLNAAAGLVRHHATGIVLFWSVLGAATLVLAMTAMLGHAEAIRIMLLPSVIVNGAAALFFGRTLLPGSIPLIAQVIRVETPDIPLDKAAYARSLTVVWTVFFIQMTLVAIALALWADLAVWSWFANVLNPSAAALLFFGEHLLRPARFGGPASPIRTLRLMLHAPIWRGALS